MAGGFFKGLTNLSDKVFGGLPPLLNPGSDLYRDIGISTPEAGMKNFDAALGEGNWNPYGGERSGFDILAGGTMADKGGYRDVGRAVGTIMGGWALAPAASGAVGAGGAEVGGAGLSDAALAGGGEVGSGYAASAPGATSMPSAVVDSEAIGSMGTNGTTASSTPAWSKWARLAQGGMGGGQSRGPAQLQWNDYAGGGDASMQELIRLLREAK